MPRDTMQISFKRLDFELPIPTTAHEGDAAVDLHARIDVELGPGERTGVPTGIAVAIPQGYAGLVLPRSGHAMKLGIGMVNGSGLIDSGFRGEISVLLINHSSEKVVFERGDRVAQLAVVPVASVGWTEVDSLDGSERGEDGFGSSGV